MDLANGLYIVILIFAIFIQAALLIFTNMQMDMRKQTQMFRWLILCSIFICISDAMARIVSLTNDYGTMFENLSYMFNAMYFIAQGCVAVLWFLYALNEIDQRWLEKPSRVALALVPVLCLVFFVLISGVTEWLFYIDNNNVYHRGPLFILHPLVCVLYLAIPSVLALWKMHLKEYYIHRNKLITISLFSVIIMPFVVLQMVLGNDYPLFCVGYTLALLLLHVSRQNLRITIDELTGVSNRSQAMRYLGYKMAAPAENGKQLKSLYLMMVDIDKFKQINDNFGHVEGDEALKRTSAVLKRSVPRNFFIGRYGGDEFIIVGEADRETEIEEVCQRIQDNLIIDNAQAMVPYRLSVSIGYSVRNGQIASIPEFIRQADQKLYRNKNSRN